MKEPKTKAGVRDVPCPTHILQMLREWIDVHYIDNKAKAVLTTNSGKSVISGTWHRSMWKPVIVGAGLMKDDKCLTFHSLRHFAGSLWIENGIPIPLVSKWLGHANPAITMKVYAYALASDRERHEAMEGIATNFIAARRDNRATPASMSLM